MPGDSCRGPRLREVQGAILRATRPGEKGPIAQICAVFGPDGRAVETARTTARELTISLPCACPKPTGLPLRRGRWLFGGIGFHHFGHALIFSTARLWALDQDCGPLDGILFFDRDTSLGTRPGTTKNLTAILEVLGIGLPVVTVGQDERVETLMVPDEGISTTEALFDGTEVFRRFLRHRIDRGPAPEGHPDLYVSRTKLGLHRAGLMFEDLIESQLAAAGYHVFHPQRASLAEQVAAYRAARRIIGVDGSAMHLVAFAARPDARVAVLGRRPYYAKAIASQIRHLSGGAEAVALDTTREIHVQATFARSAYPWLWTYALPDLPGLGNGLAAAGFLPGAPDWGQPDTKTLTERLALIARRVQSPLVVL